MTLALVDGLDSASSFNTVGLVGERFLDIAALVAIQSTVHRGRIGISRIRIPLGHDHTRFASNWAVVAWLTLLVRAHSPSSVLLIRSDGNQVGIVSRESTRSSLDNRVGLGTGVNMTVGVSQALMGLVHSSVLRTGIASSDENGSGAENGLKDRRLHVDKLV